MAYTETYENVLKRWAAKCGLEFSDLQANEQDLFKEFANYRLREIWDSVDWPETIDQSEEFLFDQSFTQNESVSHILDITNVNQFSTTSDRVLHFDYRMVQDTIYVYGHDVPESVFVLYKKRYPEFDSSTDTVPRRFSEYIAQGAYSDWLRAEQDPRAEQEEMRTQNMLYNEIDILERQERQGRWGPRIKVYSPPII